MNDAVIAGLIAQAKRSPVLSGKKYRIRKASTRNGTTMINATFVAGRMRSSRSSSLDARLVLSVIQGLPTAPRFIALETRGAVACASNGIRNRIRTGVTAVKGR